SFFPCQYTGLPVCDGGSYFFNSLGNTTFSVCPLRMLPQSVSANDIETKPEVGTFSIARFPKVLTKLVIAALCPKRIRLSYLLSQLFMICSSFFASNV